MKNLKAAIYISGKLCSGKSTLVDGLVAAFPQWQKYSIIQWLRDGVGDLAGVPCTPANKHLFRPVLQDFVDLREALGTLDKRIMQRALAAADGAGHEFIIFEDGRFPYEVEGLYDSGLPYVSVRLEEQAGMAPELWQAMRVERHRKLYGKSPTWEALNHKSETALDAETHDVTLDATQRPTVVLADAIWRINDMFAATCYYDGGLYLPAEQAVA